MFKINSFILNGKSTADFPFPVMVVENDPPQRANKKDKIIDNEFSSGHQKQSVEAYESKVKSYTFRLLECTTKELRSFKSWIADEGWFTPADERDLKYSFDKSEMKIDPIDTFGGYNIQIDFSCQPFGMEEEIVISLKNNQDLYNHTDAPMYPLIEIVGVSTTQTFLKIGDQKMVFKELNGSLFIECKHGYQDIYSSNNKHLNGRVNGPFFVVQKGISTINIGEGITEVRMTCRWGWR